MRIHITGYGALGEGITIKIMGGTNMEFDILTGYTIINGFGFTALTNPRNVHDTIIVKCDGVSECESPQFSVPCHPIEEYIEIINKNMLEKAIVIVDDISFLPQCPTLKFLQIVPSYQASSMFDFSPLYRMPEILSLNCQNIYGDREQYMSKIDYAKIHGLASLGVSVNEGTINYNKVETLKTLQVSGFRGENKDLSDLTCSKNLDTLRLIQCNISSLNGIEVSHKMQCLYLDYNRSLYDIGALSRIKETLKVLHIDSCPKIQDFSVLEELEGLESLELVGNNTLPDLSFLKKMKNLKRFVFAMNVLDGNLNPCLDVSYVCSLKNRKHYNLKDCELPKGVFISRNESIEEWRRIE